MTLVRIARWTDDLTLDFAPGVRLGVGVSGWAFCLLEDGRAVYSFLNMIVAMEKYVRVEVYCLLQNPSPPQNDGSPGRGGIM